MSVRQRLLLALSLATASVVVVAAAPAPLNEPLTGQQVFPVTNWWNLDVAHAPVDARSQHRGQIQNRACNAGV